MAIHRRVIQADANGAGTIGVPPGRLAGLLGGTVSNRGNVFTPGDRLPNAEELFDGVVALSGATAPNALVTLWLDLGGGA